MKTILERAKEIRNLMEDDLNESRATTISSNVPGDIRLIKTAFLDGYICCLNSYLYWVKDLIREAENEQKKTARLN